MEKQDTEMTVLEKQKQELIDKIDQLRSEHDGVLNIISIDKGRVKDIKQNVENLEQTEREAERKTSAIKSDMATFKSLRDEAADELNRINNEISGKKGEISKLDAEKLSLEKSLEEASAEHTQTINKLERDSEEAVSLTKNRLLELSREESSLLDSISKERKALKDTAQACFEKNIELEKLDVEILDKKKQIDESDLTLEKISVRAKAITEQEDAKVAEAQEKNQLIESEVRDRKNDLDALKAEMGEVNLELSKLREEETNYNAKLLNLRKLRAQITEKEEYLRDKYQELGLEYR